MRSHHLIPCLCLSLGLLSGAAPASNSTRPVEPQTGWRFQVQRAVEHEGTSEAGGRTTAFLQQIDARWLDEVTHAELGQVVRTVRRPLHLQRLVNGEIRDLSPPTEVVHAQRIDGVWGLYGPDKNKLTEPLLAAAIGGPPSLRLWPNGPLREGRRWCLSGDRLEQALAPLGVKYGSLELTVERLGREPVTGLQTAYLVGDLYAVLPHESTSTELRARVEIDLPIRLGMVLRLDVSGRFEADEPGSDRSAGRLRVQGRYRWRQTLAPSRAVLAALDQPSAAKRQTAVQQTPVYKPRITERLLAALKHGNMEQFELMLRLGADPNVRGESACPLLHEALQAEDGDLGWARARALIAHGADLNLTCQGLGTPLLLAIDRRLPLEPVISGLLEAGADPDMPSAQGETPLMRALQYRFGQTELVRLLLEAGADVQRPAADGNSLLLHAMTADKETLALLLQYGAEPWGPNGAEPILLTMARRWDGNLQARNAPNDRSDNASSSAMRAMDASLLRDSLRLMLRRGADLQNALDAAEPSSRERQRLLALGLREAVSCGALKTVRGLLQQGADPLARWDASGQCSLLDTALLSHGDETALVNLLLAAGAPLDQACHEAGPPLVRAAETAPIAVLRALLNRGADPNAVAGDGDGPLSKALMRGDPRDELAVLRLLMNAGADVRHRNDDGETVLHKAAYLGSADAVRALLAGGASLDARDQQGNTPLMTAFRLRERDTADALIQAGADLNARDGSGAPLLHAAAAGGDLELVKLLLQAGADWRARDSSGRTALHQAAGRGRIRIMDHLLRQGADANALTRSQTSPLHRVADLVDWDYENGHAALEMLLTAGAWVDQQDDAGETALMETIREGHAEGAERLIAAGADIHLQNRRGETVLLLVAGDDDSTKLRSRARRRLLETLLEKGADPNARDASARSVLHRIAAGGQQDEDIRNAELVLRFGADPALRDRQGKVAGQGLSYFKRKEWLDGAERLGAERVPAWLKGDFDAIRSMAAPVTADRQAPPWQVDARDMAGLTRLMRAARAGYPAGIRYYLQRGAQVNATDPGGMTALMLAAIGNRSAATELLLSQGADPAMRQENGFTPLLLAAIGGAPDSIKMLLRHGVPVDERDTDGHTALWHAAQQQQGDVARLLLDRGADVNAGDEKGWTPLMAAAIENDLEMARLLLERGADPDAETSDGISAEVIAIHKEYDELVALFESVQRTASQAHAPLNSGIRK